MNQLKLWPEAPPVSLSVSPDCAEDSETIAEIWPSSIAEFCHDIARVGSSGKTSPERYRAGAMRRKVRKLKRTTRKTSGKVQILTDCSPRLQSAGIVVPGESWTLSISESRSD